MAVMQGGWEICLNLYLLISSWELAGWVRSDVTCTHGVDCGRFYCCLYMVLWCGVVVLVASWFYCLSIVGWAVILTCIWLSVLGNLLVVLEAMWLLFRLIVLVSAWMWAHNVTRWNYWLGSFVFNRLGVRWVIVTYISVSHHVCQPHSVIMVSLSLRV